MRALRLRFPAFCRGNREKTFGGEGGALLPVVFEEASKFRPGGVSVEVGLVAFLRGVGGEGEALEEVAGEGNL